MVLLIMYRSYWRSKEIYEHGDRLMLGVPNLPIRMERQSVDQSADGGIAQLGEQ